MVLSFTQNYYIIFQVRQSSTIRKRLNASPEYAILRGNGMNRILFEESEIKDGVATFGGERAAHVTGFLHGEIGQTIRTGVVGGKVGTSVIESIGADGTITARCTHDSDAPAPWIDVILAPPRPRALKRLLPQLAQLGVRRLTLVGAAKVEKAFWGATLLKEEIYRPLLIDGLMQAATSIPPTIECQRPFRRWMEAPDGFERRFEGQRWRAFGHPSGSMVLPPPPVGTVPVIAIGPEGGWTAEETALLESHGFMKMSLGPRILRTDTAAVAIIARLLY